MTPAALSDSLQRLHRNGHPSGLRREAAEAVSHALATGSPLPPGVLDPRIAAVVGGSGASDAPAAIASVVAALGETADHVRVLRGAGTYPLVLAASVGLAAVTIGAFALPALALFRPGSSGPIGLSIGVAGALLVGLAAAVLGRAPLPGVGPAWRQIDGLGFLLALRGLVGSGAPLSAAARAASATCGGAAREGGLALARALESGEASPGVAPLLSPLEAGLFMSAARHGQAEAALDALIAHRRRVVGRVVPDATFRVHTAALVLAGLALLVVGGTFYAAYGSAVLAGVE
jgi:hypothetical protein